MAWWDHEELKAPENRSDRYILAFPSEYPNYIVEQARIRREQEETIRRVEKALKEMK